MQQTEHTKNSIGGKKIYLNKSLLTFGTSQRKSQCLGGEETERRRSRESRESAHDRWGFRYELREDAFLVMKGYSISPGVGKGKTCSGQTVGMALGKRFDNSSPQDVRALHGFSPKAIMWGGGHESEGEMQLYWTAS